MSKCPTFQVVGILGKKWTVVLIQEVALNGENGFNAIFKRMKKISPKILSQRLKELENISIIEKVLINEKLPVRTKYKLTAKGKELQSIIESIKGCNIRYSDHQIECYKKECVKCLLY